MSIYDFKIKKRNGEVIKRYAPTFEPKNMENDILKLLM